MYIVANHSRFLTVNQDNPCNRILLLRPYASIFYQPQASYVTGFTKTDHNVTRTEIQTMLWY